MGLRIASGLLLSAALLAGADASAGPTAPTPEQASAFLAGEEGPIVLVRFLSVRNESAFSVWHRDSAQRVVEAGGARVYCGTLDSVPGEALREYGVLIVDRLPSRAAALEALPAAQQDMALLATHVFAVRPTGAIARNVIGAAARLLHWLAPIEVSPVDPPRIESGPTTLSPRAADLLWNTDASTPLVVVNLNQSREVARYEGGSAPEAGMSGEEAYRLYGRNTLPHLFRRGGRPLVIGDHVELLVGDPRHPLSADWNSFALVYYPTRMALRHMVTDPDWRKGVRDRTAGLERAAVVPGTPWPEYAPR